MTAVALTLFAVERARQLGRKPAALPVGVAAGERDHVLVAELLERLRGEGRAVAGGAVEEDRLGAIGGRLLDARLEVAAREVDRARDTALGPLVQLADVDDERALRRVEQLARPRDVDLVDLRLDLLEIFAVVWHRFRKCSDPVRGYARSVATEARPLVAARNRRIVVIVALAALIAAAAVVGITLLQTRGERTTVPGAVTSPQPGNPPLRLDFGVDTSAEARALIRAQALYDRNHVAQAAPIFARYHTLEAEIGSAFTAWNENGLATLQSLAAAHPSSSAALLHLGIADYWAGHAADAVAAWE